MNLWLKAIGVTAVGILIWAGVQYNRPRKTQTNLPAERSAMNLSSTAFENNQNIPAKYTCDGTNINPPLKIADVPAGAKSLALIVDDPDAPRGVWVHWTLWNIAPATTEIAEGATPAGAVEGQTDFGKPGWGGPCPPSGIHRYQFKLYALDTALELPESANKQALEQAMQGHILEQTVLVGLYARSQKEE